MVKRLKHIPGLIETEDYVYYDLPGFQDTRGPEISLLNASFIKNIIENANSVRIVFVVL